jgi:S-adenosylmethionine decarboxylase
VVALRHQVGTHFVADLSKCEANFKTWEPLLSIGMTAVKVAGMTPLDYCGVTISNGVTSGATLVIILKESHLSVHTWPELGYAAIDLFTCGDREKGERGFFHVVDAFSPGRCDVVEIKRVVRDGDGG